MIDTGWILTDDSTYQYLKQIPDTFTYKLIQMEMIDEINNVWAVYSDTINATYWIDNYEDDVTTIVNSYGYTDIDTTLSTYDWCGSAYQIIAEMIFETNIYSANKKFQGSEQECMKFIEEYIRTE